jgi:hypothetical protein
MKALTNNQLLRFQKDGGMQIAGGGGGEEMSHTHTT